MSNLPYTGQSQRDEHEKEVNAKRSLLIGYDADTLSYNKVKVTSDGKIAVNATVTATGSDGAIVDGANSAIKATVKDLTNSNPLTTAIVDANGDQITSFGGGTQYTEGDTDASITGTAVMVEDAANTLRPVPGDATKGMKVQITDGSGNQITSFGGGTQYTEGDVDASLTGTIAMAEGPSNTATPLQVDASSHLQVDLAAASTSVTVSDGGGSLTVDNNGTFAVQAAQSGTWNVTNVSGTVSLPTGASTLTEQQTQTTHLSTIAGDTTNIETATQLLDDAIVADDAAFTPATTKVNMAGFEVDETATDTLDEGDAGAARIDSSRRQLMRIVGATDANRADVDASGHLQVDLAASSTSVTVADGGGSITVDNNGTFATQAAQSGTWNINNVSGTVSLPTGASTLAEQQTQTTSLQLIDDSVVAQGTALGSTKNLMVGASVTTAAPTYTTGQINPLNLATTGALRVDIGATSANATAVKVNVDSGGIASGAIASGAIASGAIASGAIAAGAIAAGATSIAENEDAAHTTGDRGVKVWGVSNEANTARAADGDYVPFATDTEGNTRIVGNRDSDAVDAGEPVKTGGQARTTNPTAVADADRVNFIADKLGKQVVVGSIRELKGRQTTTITASTSETTIVTAAASTFLDLYGLILANSGTTATTVQLRDATAGTVLATFYVPAGDTRGFMLPESAALAQTTVNTNWTAQCGSSTSSMIITALYVKNT